MLRSMLKPVPAPSLIDCLTAFFLPAQHKTIKKHSETQNEREAYFECEKQHHRTHERQAHDRRARHSSAQDAVSGNITIKHTSAPSEKHERHVQKPRTNNHCARGSAQQKNLGYEVKVREVPARV